MKLYNLKPIYSMDGNEVLFLDGTKSFTKNELDFFNINWQVKNLNQEFGNINSVNIQPYYNFYEQEYEKTIKGLENENRLPSVYAFAGSSGDSVIFRTYSGSLDDNRVKKDLTSGQYFDDLVEKFDSVEFLTNIMGMFSTEKFNRTLISKAVLEKTLNLENSFPAYNKIEILCNDSYVDMARKLESLDILDDLSRYIVNNQYNDLPKDVISCTLDSTRTDLAGVPISTYENKKISFGALKHDFSENVGQFLNKLLTDKKTSDYSYFSEKQTGDTWNIQKVLTLKKLLDSNFKTETSDISGNRQEDCNVVLFEIEKYSLQEDGSLKQLQSFFVLPNKQVDFYDTQVIEGKKYVYQIYAHVLQSNIKYKLIDKKTAKGDIYKIASSTSGVAIVRIPWYNTPETKAFEQYEFVCVKNKPPLSPDISITSFDRTDNKVLINLHNRQGTEITTPIFLSGDERKKFMDLYDIKYNNIFDAVMKVNGVVEYVSDDYYGAVETYRIDKEPTSYEDFSPTNKTRVNQSWIAANNHFVDTIQPNKKYYYCSRVKDIHGNISNPSIILQVQIISSDDSLPLLVVNPYEFKDKELKKEKSFMKYVMIRLAQNQYEIQNLNEINSGKEKQPRLGSIFGKKFIVEVTSKKTGKKIDLVVNVNVPKQIDNR